MPLAVHSDDIGGFEQLISLAGVAQIDTLPSMTPVPASLVATTGKWTSGLIFSDGYKTISVGVTTSQAGTLKIQRYIDRAGLIAQQAVTSTSIVAATPLLVNVGLSTDAFPFQTFTVEIDNTAGVTSNITSFGILLCASWP